MLVLKIEHHSHNINDLLHYLIQIFNKIKFFQKKTKQINLPDDDPSCGVIILPDRVILAVSESVSIQERIAATVALGIDLAFGI